MTKTLAIEALYCSGDKLLNCIPCIPNKDFQWELNILIEDAKQRNNQRAWIFEGHCHLLDSIVTLDLPSKIIRIGDLLKWGEYNTFSVSD